MRPLRPRFGRCARTIAGALLAISAGAASNPYSGHIITWGGNSAPWNRLLGVDGIRLGCSSPPDSCVNDAEQMARSQGVKRIFISILLNSKALANAALYSRLSVHHPVVYEIGLDDFVSQAEKQQLSQAALNSELDAFAWQLKSVNADLKLGITLYMDQVPSNRLDLTSLSARFRRAVDYVHLYPHYRQEAQSFASAVRSAQEIFPGARVIAGVYAYDRRDYLPCSKNGARCSNEQELSLFRDSFQERWDMLREGRIAAIEFYPGSFGLESQWPGWNYPRSCQQGRRQECVANTQAMRRMIEEIMGNGPLSRHGGDQ